jgi:ABC-type Fe3+ transport system permease subunit
VGVLALTEVPATYLVRPAGVESVAMTLFNEIHHGRNDVIVAMSLYVMVAVGVVVTVAQCVLARPRRRLS